MKLPVLAQDKANHAVYGSIIFAVVYLLVMLFRQPALAIPLAAAATLGAAVLKERLDKEANDEALTHGEPLPHGVEKADIWATLLGAAPCALVVLVLHGMLGVPILPLPAV